MNHISTAFGIVPGVPDEEYHAHPALSQSSLKTLLDCPARFAYEAEHPREVGAAADLGSVVHGIVLGTGWEVVVVDAPDWRTKDAQAARKRAIEAGGVAVLASAYGEAHEMAEAVLAHPEARALLEAEGDVELSLFWQRQQAGQSVAMRGRIDKVAAGPISTTLVDLKSARSASPRFFATQVLNYGYHIQQAVYQDGWETITGDPAGFAFIVVESARPFLTTVYRLDPVLAAHGRREYDRAMDLYLDCTATGEWPGYPGGVLRAPSWLARQVQDAIEGLTRGEAIYGDPWGEQA